MSEPFNHGDADSVFERIVGRESVPKQHALVRILFHHHDPLDIPIEAWIELGLKVEQMVPDDVMAVLVSVARDAQAYEMALQYVSRRSRTESEVSRMLRQQGISSDVSTRVLARLKARNYVDDSQYVRRFVRQHAQIRSRREIEWRLSQKGIHTTDGFEDFTGEMGFVNERETARMQAKKCWKRHAKEEWSSRRKKVLAFLQRKGFPMSLSISVVQELEQDDQDGTHRESLP